VLDGDTQRVRILSTLESTRQASRSSRASKRRALTLPKNWQLKVLMGLMAMGVLSLLTAFALIIFNGHRGSDQADTNVPVRPERSAIGTVRVDRSNPLAALIATPSPMAGTSTSSATAIMSSVDKPERDLIPPPAPEPTAAVIETIESAPPAPRVPGTSTATASGQKSTALHTVLAAQGSHPAMLAASAAASSTTRSIDATAYAAMTSAKPARPAAKRNPSRDDDVALLEAMFAHTGNSRAASPPPMSAAEEIKTRCNVQSGAAAATCRARVCVQNPSAAVCHQDP
jgi:hypothetical protein